MFYGKIPGPSSKHKRNMELSAIALKTLISFSLGLSANILQNNNSGDSLCLKKNVIVNIKRNKKSKPQELKDNNYAPKASLEELNSCNKCGKG